MPHHNARRAKLEQPQTADRVNPQAEQSIVRGPQDTQDPRAKNSGHREKTADKWNQ